jgi:hypothetical protein
MIIDLPGAMVSMPHSIPNTAANRDWRHYRREGWSRRSHLFPPGGLLLRSASPFGEHAKASCQGSPGGSRGSSSRLGRSCAASSVPLGWSSKSSRAISRSSAERNATDASCASLFSANSPITSQAARRPRGLPCARFPPALAVGADVRVSLHDLPCISGWPHTA